MKGEGRDKVREKGFREAGRWEKEEQVNYCFHVLEKPIEGKLDGKRR
jgi:hypothetical protein